MKHRDTPAVTSLPQAPQDEASSRVRHYVITMSIRVVCFILMAVVTPYGWYTWVFAIAAAVLPYIAVVFANEGGASSRSTVEAPEIALESAPSPPQDSAQTTEDPSIITIQEIRKDDDA